MTFPEAFELSISDIDVPIDRARAYDEADAEALAAVIAAQGLHHPIRVRALDSGYRLISGLRRLRAFELLQRDTIPATISAAATDEAARLEEVMENLGRAELIALDRCHHLYELKVAWLALHPEINHGGDRKSAKRQSLPLDQDGAPIFGFSKAVAEKVGLSDRAIRLAVKIWTDLTPASRGRLDGTKLADKQTELKALSEQKPQVQARILDLILGDDHPDIENVASALEFIQGGVQPTALERRYRALCDGLAALPDPTFDQLLIEHEARVLGALKRLGRI